MPIRVIAFDADDTLWINETYFREAEENIKKNWRCECVWNPSKIFTKFKYITAYEQ